MINRELVGATLKAFEDIFEANGVPYKIEDSEAYRTYADEWEKCGNKEEILRQAAPAVRRIASKEPYLFEKGGEPLMIRFNDSKRKMEDSFGDMLLERADLNWRFAMSVKYDAAIIAALPFAGRDLTMDDDEIVNSFNEIDDFGENIFGIPCSNEYFIDMNEILMKIAPHDEENWSQLVKDEKFVYGSLITPMLSAIGREMPRICSGHPEAPQKMIDYFYRKIDYYFIYPIRELEVTRIGAVNVHGDLGRIPNNPNSNTPKVEFPTKLLDVRFARGRYGELSRDTIQLNFDGGWALCITIKPVYDTYGELGFDLKVSLPVTPFGSYRDQVDWD